MCPLLAKISPALKNPGCARIHLSTMKNIFKRDINNFDREEFNFEMININWPDLLKMTLKLPYGYFSKNHKKA